MTEHSTLAGFIADARLRDLPDGVIRQAKRHFLDSLAALLVGLEMEEARAVAGLARALRRSASGPPAGPTLSDEVMTATAAARCTEVDDIHLASCTTPGSVIVPTALALARHGHFSDSRELLPAVVLGSEALIRIGLATAGPEMLYRGVWPTYLAAPLGTAALTARALGLNAEQVGTALANALGMTAGTSVRGRTPASSRWLMAGVAAKNGVLAAFSAREGFVGDGSLIPRESRALAGVTLDGERLRRDVGATFECEATGIKPYPVARQGYAAVEAFRELLREHEIDPASVESVRVEVPPPFLAIIDHPRPPEGRLESVVGVQYQMALAALHPDGLHDVTRRELKTGQAMSDLMARISVAPAEDLARHYPEAWPARVTLIGGGGRFERELHHPPGDRRNPFDWEAVRGKFLRYAVPRLGEQPARRACGLVDGMDGGNTLPELLEVLGPAFQRMGG